MNQILSHPEHDMEPAPHTFTFSAWFKFLVYLDLFIALALLAFLGYLMLLTAPGFAASAWLIMIVILIMPFIHIIYVVKAILPQLNDTIVLTTSTISLVRMDNVMVMIGWPEITRINNNMRLQRLEIYTNDADRKLFIEHQVGNYRDLLDQIVQQLQRRPEGQAILANSNSQ